MTKGAEHWQDPNRYHSQENNPTEAYNKARLASRATYWLETCGPTAAVNAMAAMGYDLTVTTRGVYNPQPEEVLMDFLNDPRNDAELDRIRELSEDIPENQVPQFYPYAVLQVFGVPAAFDWGTAWGQIVADLDNGRAVMVCLKEPGHYIAIVAYDAHANELVFHDSWGSRPGLRNRGRAERMSVGELQSNVQPYRVTFGRAA